MGINQEFFVIDDDIDTMKIDIDAVGVKGFAMESTLLRKRDYFDRGLRCR